MQFPFFRKIACYLCLKGIELFFIINKTNIQMNQMIPEMRNFTYSSEVELLFDEIDEEHIEELENNFQSYLEYYFSDSPEQKNNEE